MKKPKLQEKYEGEITKVLAEEVGIKNPLAVPRLMKVVVNMGIGDVLKNKETIALLKTDLATITGQTPSVSPARVSIASFGIRQGMPVGLAVTLRSGKMYSFLDRLFAIVLPRLRDFKGVSRKSFDRSGNYTLGFKEHTVFPEIDLSKANPHGLEITLVTNTKDRRVAEKLLSLLGMPFAKEES